MSRFHQRLRKDLKDPEFAAAFYDMSVDIALLQVLEQARRALNVSEKELAERMGIPRDAQRDTHSPEGSSQARFMLSLFSRQGSETALPYGKGEYEGTLSSPFTAELHLVAHPVGGYNVPL